MKMQSVEEMKALADELLAVDLSSRGESFGRRMADLVASQPSGNRYSTSLMSSLETAAKEEFRARAAVVTAAWRRVLRQAKGGDSEAIARATALAQSRVDQEQAAIEVQMSAVEMGSVPMPVGFLSALAGMEKECLAVELRMPDPLASGWGQPSQGSDEVVEIRPNFFGLGVNLRALWRQVSTWWHRK